MSDAGESLRTIGRQQSASTTSAPSERQLSFPWMLSAEASPVRTSPLPEPAAGLPAPVPVFGSNTIASSASSAPASLSSRTSLDFFGGAWTRFSKGYGLSVTRWRGPESEPLTLARLIGESVCSYLPTPSAVAYGTNMGGAAGRRGKVRPSLYTMAKRGQWPDGCADRGLLSPLFVEWMMAFPIGWTACAPLETPSCRPARPSLARE